MKKISLALIILILVGICIPAVSAETIISEHFEDYLFTGGQSTVTGTGRTPVTQPVTQIILLDIQRSATLNYIAFDIRGDKGASEVSAPFTYSLPDGPQKNGYCYVDHSYNVIGNVIATRYTLFFYDWDIGSLTGSQLITFNRTIAYVERYATENSGSNNGDSYAVLAANTYFLTPTQSYITTVSSSAYWENILQVNRQNDGLDYNVVLQREFGDKNYGSQIEIVGNTGAIYSSYDSIDIDLIFPADSINNITITNPYDKVFSIPIVSQPEDPDEDSGITVYIKNSQTGALIANANVVIDGLVDGEYYPVTNRTEPSGIFSINLQPTGGGQPNPDSYRLIVTADGYNNPMPEINFTLGDYRKYFECFLDPIAGGPADENKTFIDFFVRDMSSNPISGATVKFGKYTLITNSAGYTVFEVDKNTNYSWIVSKSGYGALTGNAVIGNDPRHTINTVLAPIVTPTQTTPIPTSPPIGPTPTMTAPSGEPVSNWLEWFAAHFGMILGGGIEIGKIFMWLCFTVPVGVYVGKESKAGAAGFMAGAGIVTLFFVLIGWVPIWLVVLLALIIGLLYAKVFNAQDNGGGR